MKDYLSALLLTSFLFPPVLFGEVLFDPPSAVLPADGESVLVELRNADEGVLEIDFLPSVEGLTVTPPHLAVRGGASASFVVSRQGELPSEGAVVLMLSDRQDVPYLYSLLSPDSAVPEEAAVSGGEGRMLFFHTPGCGICETFYAETVPRLEELHGLSLEIEKMNIFDPGSFEVLRTMASERGVVIRDFPALVAGDHIFLGERGLFEEFPDFLESGRTGEENVAPVSGEGGLAELSWLPVFLAGLLDGINPCAFTTLIFMISYLRLLGRRGRDILWIGGSFTLAVFLCYFLIGLGAFQFIRAASSFALVAALIRYVLGAGLLVLAVLSLVDYARVRQGRAEESILQLSTGRKKKIHRTLRQSNRSALLCLSSFGAGFLISLYELGCTGQIYLPMLVYMVRQGHRTALGPLLLYNVAFILPLAGVFLFFYKGSDSDRIGALFAKHLGKIKLLTALLFLAMGLYVLVS